MPWTVSWQVAVDGQDMTSAMRPYLTEVSVTDKDGLVSDTCDLTFDDAGGQIRLPSAGSAVTVTLQGVPVFKGIVDRVRSRGSRGGGRMLTVSAKGFDSQSAVKQAQSFHADNATLGDFLGQAAKHAGLSGLTVDPSLAGIVRDYWAADGESLLHLGQRLAREFYATFKIRGDLAVFVPRGADFGLPVIAGIVGENVISWDIAPVKGRERYARATVSYFDRRSASFRNKDVAFAVDDPEGAGNVVRGRVADDGQADSVGKGRKAEADRDGGEGTVELDLTAAAQAEGLFALSGARPGIDGTYRIVSVRHEASRDAGSRTSLEIKQPASGAGSDTRK